MFKYTVSSLAWSQICNLKIAMCETYGPLIQACFPHLSFKWKLVERGYGETTVLAESADQKAITNLLKLFQECVLLLPNDHLKASFNGEMEHCFALDYNFERDPISDEWKYTTIGSLEHQAKEKKNVAAATELVSMLARFCMIHPFYQSVQVLIPVPGNPSKQWHFPHELAKGMVKIMDVQDGTGIITKEYDTGKVKDLPLDQKIAEIEPALRITADIKGKIVCLIDDLYQSGSTIWAVARLAKAAGAKHVFGLAVVKSRRGTDNQ